MSNKKEYVEREAVKQMLENAQLVSNGEYCGYCTEDISVDNIPTADVAEVRHGEWVEYWDDNYLSFCHKCSECGGLPLTKEETIHDEVLSAYCPHCGAKMDGKGEGE